MADGIIASGVRVVCWKDGERKCRIDGEKKDMGKRLLDAGDRQAVYISLLMDYHNDLLLYFPMALSCSASHHQWVKVLRFTTDYQDEPIPIKAQNGLACHVSRSCL